MVLPYSMEDFAFLIYRSLRYLRDHQKDFKSVDEEEIVYLYSMLKNHIDRAIEDLNINEIVNIYLPYNSEVFEKYKDYGDRALLMSGLFREYYLNNKTKAGRLRSIHALVTHGKVAYSKAYEVSGYDIFNKLSHDFITLSYLLYHLRYTLQGKNTI